MQSEFISYRSSQVHYNYAGSGKKALFCFHGYGEEAASFYFLQKELDKDYTIIAIDLPYHGKTNWAEGLQCQPAELVTIIDEICKKHGLAIDGLTLMGYSLGGRIVLRLFEELGKRVRALLLVAPDGLQVSFWYRLATGSAMGQRLFAFTMKNPGWLRWLLKTGKGLKLVNTGIYKFANHFLQDYTIREQLYIRWICLRSFQPNLNKVRGLLKQYSIHVNMVYGRYDRIVRHKKSARLSRGIDASCRVIILNSGHFLLHEKNASLFAELLQS